MTARRKALRVAAGVAVVLVALSAADAKGFRRYLKLKRELAVLEERNQGLREQNEALRREVSGLRADPATLERAAREELGFVKPGEIVFHVE